jgi:hypothetical protein
MLSGFQSDAFQFDAYQIGRAEQNSGGYFYGTAVFDRVKRKREQLEALPEPVQEIVSEALQLDSKADRAELLSKIDADFKFIRLYEAIVEQYLDAVLEYELSLQLQESERLAKRKRDEEIAILLLL